ncbi:MAG: lipopolysaccharide biosynthesis protein [Maribacter stanieri]
MGLGNKMLSGALWSFLERISTQLLQVILGVILARLLSPSDYGLIGLMTVFIVISQVFVDSGFAKALIQKKDRNEKDISTVLIFNLFVSIICYLILWFSAPFIGSYYNAIELVDLLRVLSLSLITNAILSVPTTLATIDFNFKVIAKTNVIAVLCSGALAIYLAYAGWGVWALVYQTIIRSVLAAALLWFWSKWKPIWVFSVISFKQMFKYGSSLLMSSLLNVFTGNISSLLIGKYISPKGLGFYTQGVQYPTILFGTINAGIDKILLPGLASLQEDREVLVSHMRKIMKTAMIFVLPLFCLLVVLAEPLIKIFLTDKWLPVVPIIQIFSIARAITILSGLNINLLFIVGRTDLVLKQDYFKIPIRLFLILCALQYGIVYVALAELVSTAIHFYINSYYPGRMMNFGAYKQLKDLSGILLFNIMLVVLGFLVLSYINDDIYKLIFLPLLFLFLFLFWIKLFKVKEAHKIYHDIKKVLVKNN